MPFVVTPQVWFKPTLSAANARPPATGVGTNRSLWVPSPSWPTVFTPQQYAAPLGVTPQVRKAPALSAANVRPPAPGVGTRRAAVVPSPPRPPSLPPHQYA